MTRGKTRGAPLAISRLRLVGFHNFVDETIEIAEAGHLFLLGDNGSGKTTVLDAIHLVLTGGDIELNAAARIGGRRHEGRSLAGIVLRQGDGPPREGAAIAYAALELANGAERMVVGVGLSATTLDAHVTRWGFVHRGTLESTPLLQPRNEGRRPSTRDELALALGASCVSARIADYRARVADVLFGGEAGYQRACRLWSIAKAYRELVVSSRDPGALFERFLPAPAGEAIAAIRTSLSQLDELEAGLRSLETQRAYVAGVAECRAEVFAIRRERARLESVARRLRQRDLQREIAELVASRESARAEIARCTERLAEAETRTHHAEAALAAARTGDAAVWVAELAAAERERDARRSDVEIAEAARVAATTKWRTAEIVRADAERALGTWARETSAALGQATDEATRLWCLLPRCAALARAIDAGEVRDAEDEIARALDEARAVLADAERRCRELDEPSKPPTPVREDDATRRAIEALGRSNIEAVELALLVEPHSAADPARVAALEGIVSRDAWRTLVTRSEDVVRARALLAEHRGVRLAVDVRSAVLPGWVEAILAPTRTALEARARDLLAQELGQSEALGLALAPDALGVMVLRGTAVRPHDAACFVGASARARASEVDASARERDACALRERRESAARAREKASTQLERLVGVESACSAFSSPRAGALHAARAQSARDLVHLEEARMREERAVASASARLQQAEHAVDALRTGSEAAERTSAVGQIEAAMASARAARAERELAIEERTRWSASESALAQREEQARLRSTELGGESRSEEADTLTSAEVESARGELAQTEHARMEELLGDGSRGLRAPQGRLGLVLVSAGDEPHIEDRRGSPLGSVLAELDRSLEEARSIVSERTREIFDVIVVGSLARQLQHDVEQLHTTVAGLNELLARTTLGGTRYAFRIAPRPERIELVSLVRRMSVLDPASRTELRGYLEGRRAELAAPGDEPPTLLDYRRWFDYRLVTRGPSDAESTWTRERRAAGSGGEQGVPNHLLVFALAKLTFDATSARITPLLLDEAFQGIDAGRREGLLGFATELGLQLVVATPDQDGVVATTRATTTLFVVKDEHGDVHLAPFHYWNRPASAQKTLALGEPL